MATIKARFRAHRIINTYDLVTRFGKKGVDDYAITYHPYASRACEAAKSSVWAPGRVLNGKAHFLDRGAMAFTGDRAKSWPLAIAWGVKTLKVKEWAPCPVSPTEYIPKTVRERALAWLKEQA
jgi:hypothetical protein